jgi:hypothetical protein
VWGGEQVPCHQVHQAAVRTIAFAFSSFACELNTNYTTTTRVVVARLSTEEEFQTDFSENKEESDQVSYSYRHTCRLDMSHVPEGIHARKRCSSRPTGRCSLRLVWTERFACGTVPLACSASLGLLDSFFAAHTSPFFRVASAYAKGKGRAEAVFAEGDRFHAHLP